jgi:hemoglobin
MFAGVALQGHVRRGSIFGKTYAMSGTLYERCGGEEFFQALVKGFYSRVAVDPVLRPMYPEDLAAAERRLRLFLMQYFGGPTTYDQERGHPRLRMRHMPFVIDKLAKDIWLTCMNASLDEQVSSELWTISASDEKTLRSYLSDTAKFLINHGGLSFVR